MIHRLPEPLQELIAQFGDLTVEEQRERHLMVMKRMLDFSTMAQVRALRAESRTCYLCEWLGEAHRDAVMAMIDGHIVLRQMGLFRRHTLDENGSPRR